MTNIKDSLEERTTWDFNDEKISGTYHSVPQQKLEAILNVSQWEELSFLDQFLVGDEAKKEAVGLSTETINRYDPALYINYITDIPILHGVSEEGKSLTLIHNLVTRINRRQGGRNDNERLYISVTPRYVIEGAIVDQNNLRSSHFVVELSNPLKWIDDSETIKTASIPKGSIKLEKAVNEPNLKFYFDFNYPVKVEYFLENYVNPLKSFLMFVSDTSVDTIKIETKFGGINASIVSLGSPDGLVSEPSNRASTPFIRAKFPFADFDFTKIDFIFEKQPQYEACFHMYNVLLRSPSPSQIVNYVTSTQIVESMYIKMEKRGDLDDKIRLLNNEELPGVLDEILELDHNQIEELIRQFWKYRNKVIHNRDNNSVWDTSKPVLGQAFLTLVFEVKMLHLYGFNKKDIVNIMRDYRIADIRMLHNESNRKLLSQ